MTTRGGEWEFLWTKPGRYPEREDTEWQLECLDQRADGEWRLWTRPLPQRTRSMKELRFLAAETIGAEISDRFAARKQYGQAGTALLAAAARLLKLGKYVDPEMVSEREGE